VSVSVATREAFCPDIESSSAFAIESSHTLRAPTSLAKRIAK